MTYTVATMPVPAAVWEMIRAKLKEAGYSHAIDEREGTLDMTHIALVQEKLSQKPANAHEQDARDMLRALRGSGALKDSGGRADDLFVAVWVESRRRNGEVSD